MNAFRIPLLILAAVPFISACESHVDQGPRRTETRDVGSFDAIEMDGDARLEITVGSPESLTIEGRDEQVKRIKTEVRGNTLYIEGKHRDWLFGGGRQRMTLQITVPRLAALKLQGGNDVRLTGFDGGESRIKVEGAANIRANGQLDELTVHMAGAGHADLSRLVANEAKVTVDGVGSVYVNSTGSLDATMNGVGAILYSGNPHEVNTSMNGLGSIARHKDEHSGRKHREDRGEEKPSIDPDTLQPEYEDDDRKSRDERKIGVTEVI